MLKYFSTFFEQKSTVSPDSSGNLPPHMRTDKFDTSYAFICSLEMDEDDIHPDLEH